MPPPHVDAPAAHAGDAVEPSASPGPPRPTGTTPFWRRRGDRRVLAAGAVLVAAAAVLGALLTDAGVPLRVHAPPFFARWHPHLGPATVAAVAVAAAVVLWGDAVAARLRWGVLLAVAYVAGLGWTLALALSRGVDTGLGMPLSTKTEYLRALPEVTSVGALLSGYVDRIPIDAPGNWGAHPAGHPPGALLAFVGLDRLGLADPVTAGLVCLCAGVTGVVALAWMVRTLAGETWARAALPFLVLFPGAIWVGVSADGLFLALVAWAFALLAAALVRTGPRHDLLAAAAGLLLGYALYTSYGFVLLGIPTLVLLAWRRRVRTLLVAGAGALAVAAGFTAAGFAWWEAYPVLVERYHAGFGGERPYAYWVWGNLALLAVVVGPATWVGLRRLAGRRGHVPAGLLVPVGAMAAVVLAASLSGMSKAEVERIWLPFAAWLVLACAALAGRERRPALALQAATALVVEHLLFTRW